MYLNLNIHIYIYISVYYLFIERPESHNLAARSFNVKALRSLTFGTLVIPKPCGSSLTFLKRLVTSLEGSTRSQYTKMESEKKKRDCFKAQSGKKKMLKDLRMFSLLSLLHPFVVPIDVLLFLLHLS